MKTLSEIGAKAQGLNLGTSLHTLTRVGAHAYTLTYTHSQTQTCKQVLSHIHADIHADVHANIHSNTPAQTHDSSFHVHDQ